MASQGLSQTAGKWREGAPSSTGECPACGGTGWADDGASPCENCAAQGYAWGDDIEAALAADAIARLP